MRHVWSAALLVCLALGAGVSGAPPLPQTVAQETGTSSKPAQGTVDHPKPLTPRPPPRTLDRHDDELAWRSWLQSAETNLAPPRRITTKSLFITPLVCPKGQRLDRNGCVQIVTVSKDEHERILLEQLQALFTLAPGTEDVSYDYGDEEPGPLQLSLPIGLDPLPRPSAQQAQELETNDIKIDKKDEDAGIVAELELLKLQHESNTINRTSPEVNLNHTELSSIVSYVDKPKRDTPIHNGTVVNVTSTNKTVEEGQKEIVFGHVNIDPMLFNTDRSETTTETAEPTELTETEASPTLIPPVMAAVDNKTTFDNGNSIKIGQEISNNSLVVNPNNALTENNKTQSESNQTTTEETINKNDHVLQKEEEKVKLNPENDYSDIGEAIKLISRYAAVTTDDNFTNKDKKKNTGVDENILGSRTKLQHRRKISKPSEIAKDIPVPAEVAHDDQLFANPVFQMGGYYRYPGPRDSSVTPPADYPFRRLQDYWGGHRPPGALYGNPRRHHHSYRQYPYPLNNGMSPELVAYAPGVKPMGRMHLGRPRTRSQDLYSLLGLRHWVSAEAR